MDESRERSLTALESYFMRKTGDPSLSQKLAERMMPAETAGDVDETVGLLESYESYYRGRGIPEAQATAMARIAAYSEMEEAGPGVTETVIPVAEKRSKAKPKPKDATSHDVVLRELREMGLRGYGE